MCVYDTYCREYLEEMSIKETSKIYRYNCEESMKTDYIGIIK